MSEQIAAVQYDDTGRITQTASAPAGVLVGQYLEVEELRTDYDKTHYVARGILTARPANPARLSGRQLSYLPVPCVIVVNGARYECVDGTAELEFTYPGTYAVSVEAFPHLNAEFSVSVP